MTAPPASGHPYVEDGAKLMGIVAGTVHDRRTAMKRALTNA